MARISGGCRWSDRSSSSSSSRSSRGISPEPGAVNIVNIIRQRQLMITLVLMALMGRTQTALAQLDTQNSPPVMFLDRDWKLAENEPNGTLVTRVQAHDDNGDLLLFGLEPNAIFRGPATALDRLPFRINNRTGVVYLNESLAGRGGEMFSLYVTVSDGVVQLKNEVYVHVLPAGGVAGGVGGGGIGFGPAPFEPHARNVTDRFPAFAMLPGVSAAQAGAGAGLFGAAGNRGGGGGGGGNLPPGLFGASSGTASSTTPHRQTHTYPGPPVSGNRNDANAANDAAGDTDDDESSWPVAAHKPEPTPDNPQVYTYAAKTNVSMPTTSSTTLLQLLTTTSTTTTDHPHDDEDDAGREDAADAADAGDHRRRRPLLANGTTVVTGTGTGYTTLRISLPLVLCVGGGLILVATAAAVYVGRQYLCAVGRRIKTKSKAEMAKKSNASTASVGSSGPLGGGGSSLGGVSSLTGTEDSRNSMVLQNWTGPRAFSNRYVPWEEREGGGPQQQPAHPQISAQLSGASSTASAANGDRWEVSRHRLKFFNVLGQGAFGLVWRCEATDIDGNEGISVVAVKTLKENASDIEIKDLNSELQVMKTLEPHVNVVRLLGCCTEKDPIFVILEYVNRGKLQDYLRNSRAEKHYGNSNGKSDTLTSGDLTSFMYQVARGMEYLSSRGIIHRDLAARNILITDDHTCKVADFGFARDVVTSKVYERKSEGKLPIRWMAIESLYDDIFSVKSDIWSFGVLMWEIVTLGSTPYPGISASDVMRKVRDGYRLEKPEHCRRELYNIMYYCWAHDYKARPVFAELVQLLDRLLVTEMDYIELERFPDHNYYNMASLSGEKL